MAITETIQHELPTVFTVPTHAVAAPFSSSADDASDSAPSSSVNDGGGKRPALYRRSSSKGLASFRHLSDFLKEEGLRSKCDISASFPLLANDDPSSSSALDETSKEAIEDFALQLRYWGKSALDEEAFGLLLDDVGYSRPRGGLFESFLAEVRNASPVHDTRSLSVSAEDVGYLYRSEPYSMPRRAAFVSGDALMSYVEDMFWKADASGDNALDAEEMRVLLRRLFEGREPTEGELSEAMDTFDADKDGQIDFDEFKSRILKANVNVSSGVSSDFNEAVLCPSHTSDNEFVRELEKYTETHRAVTHHLLTNLACASFGKKETADMLLRFLSAYSQFNYKFIDNVEALLALLDNAHHADILKENLREEMGGYDLETLEACESMGIPRESLDGIPHRELFKDLVEFVEKTLHQSYDKFIPSYICKELNEATEHSRKQGKLGLLAALYFGSELIVPRIYSAILQGLRNSIGLSNEEAKFLILHIDMDQDHALALREIIASNCRTRADRLTLVECTNMLLDGRVSFYDSLIKYSSRLGHITRDSERNNSIHAHQANNWIRSEPQPKVFVMCEEHVKGSTVLDVGCGDGRVSRRLVGMGAAKIVGVDSSKSMVEVASAHPEKQNLEYYVEGDVTNLRETLLRTTNKTNLMPGAQFDLGVFDLGVAVFLFNDLTITGMDMTFKDVYSLLKPGGHFVFCVPHPFISNHDGEVFGFAQRGSQNYFSLRDKLVEGHISTTSGESLQVNMFCKTFEDYTQTARKFGFEIVGFEETRVNSDDLNGNPSFFGSVNGRPLHLLMKLRKPKFQMKNTASIVARASTLTMLPKKLTWSNAAMRHPENAFVLQIPNQVKGELYKASFECYERGISVDDLDCVGDIRSSSLRSLKSFAVSIRNRVLHETGLVLLKGLDLDMFGVDDPDKMVACSKVAYYLICNHIGVVDGSARGRLFDVKNSHVNAMDQKSDNVLFSVSNCEANWHTDGASKDKVYEAVSLLCIHPSTVGGKSKVSNACNAYDSISHMPKFLLNELLRPVSRDILENGNGNGKKMCISGRLSRADSIMSLRISYNSYPIFDVEQDRMRFRYMRHWIESSHAKMRWKVPTLLRIAMDVLDDALDKGCCFDKSLERGDIIICNNACVAHGRESFQDIPGKPPRHLVRAWMQVQKVDLLKPSNQSTL